MVSLIKNIPFRLGMIVCNIQPLPCALSQLFCNLRKGFADLYTAFGTEGNGEDAGDANFPFFRDRDFWFSLKFKTHSIVPLLFYFCLCCLKESSFERTGGLSQNHKRLFV